MEITILIINSENGDIMQNYQEIFNGIKEIIKKINDYNQPIKYDDNYMKIRLTQMIIFHYNNKIYHKKR